MKYAPQFKIKYSSKKIIYFNFYYGSSKFFYEIFLLKEIIDLNEMPECVNII
jgi:hypothetical protein